MAIALSARFLAEGVFFASYPFPGASIYPSGLLPWSRVVDVDPDAAPPELRTADEVLFVPAAQRDELRAAPGVRIVRCTDVWALLLEPFLDTEFSVADKERTLSALARCGLDADQVDALRNEVEGAMVAYNFDSMLWDWVHLGLQDLLQALRGELSGPRHRLRDAAFIPFYWRAMAIAMRGAP